MTQFRTPGTGGFYIDSNQLPTALTWPAVSSLSDRMAVLTNSAKFRDVSLASGNTTFTFVAQNNGRVAGIQIANGATAADGTNSVKIVVTNTTNSADVLGSFGFGSGSNAAAAAQSNASVLAAAESEIANTDTSFFNKGDVILVTDTRDGTAITYSGALVLDYGSQGR